MVIRVTQGSGDGNPTVQDVEMAHLALHLTIRLYSCLRLFVKGVSSVCLKLMPAVDMMHTLDLLQATHCHDGP